MYSKDKEKKRGYSKKTVLSMDKNEMIQERERLKTELEVLENKNYLSAKKSNDLNFRIRDKKNEKKKVEKELDEQNRKLIKLLTKESSLVNEIEFYNSEKEDISDARENISRIMDSCIHDAGKSVKDIGFIKGETGALIKRINLLESDIPQRNTQNAGLDDSIFGAVKALTQLYGRMQKIEKQAKVYYYNNKKQ